MKSLSEDSHDDDTIGDFKLLNEEDIPGASLDGKNPHKLNISKLKRWLTCCGAPVSRKKPELIERFVISIDIMTDMIYVYVFNRVECYIKYGWDQFIIDPDN